MFCKLDVLILTRISNRVKSKLPYTPPDKNLASSSTVIYPLWLSSSSSQAFLTLLKLLESLFFKTCSKILTLTATFSCLFLFLVFDTLKLPVLVDVSKKEIVALYLTLFILPPFSSELLSDAMLFEISLATSGKKVLTNRS